ncbi:hypothetical protein H263_00545 [Brachyspira hampsonii 30599]|nr:hypothetical protein H263_00545 [Brachyspira hampsonii 30599]
MSDYEYQKAPEKTVFIKKEKEENLKVQRNVSQAMLK